MLPTLALAKKNLSIFEMTMHSLKDGDKINEQDFLDRVRTLASTGHHVIVSNFFVFHRLKHYLRQYTAEPIAMTVGGALLDRIFDEKHYQDLEGGILEGLGKLLDEKTHLFVYPAKSGKALINAVNFNPKATLDPLYRFFTQHQWIKDIADPKSAEEFITSEKALSLIKSKDKQWEKHVPSEVAKLIKSEQLFGYK